MNGVPAHAPGQARRNVRVLLVLTEVLTHGGIQRFNRTLLTALDNLGVDCDVISLNDVETAEANPSFARGARFEGYGREKLLFSAGLARRLAGEAYDAIFIGHLHFAALVAGALCLPRAKRASRILLIAHGLEVWSSIRGVARRAVADATDIVSVSHYTQDSMLAQAPELAAKRLHVCPNALATSWIEWADRLKAAPTSTAHYGRFFLTVTRLSVSERTKGVVTALEAFSAIDAVDTHYVIAGGGDDIGFLKWVARQLNVADRVHFVGSVSDEELVALYRDCAAFVLPSGQEGFGIVFLEAMYFGSPVIAAREKGAVDVVTDGVTGLTIDFGDVCALKAAMQEVLVNDGLRARLVAGGRGLVTGGGPFTFASFTSRAAGLIGLAADPAVA